ncbi:MAG: hypothetical protein K2X47_13460 [Bdellovibrionales bacterium]|nr:hypothetical protein [Bdellovibrionales bacterium]
MKSLIVLIAATFVSQFAIAETVPTAGRANLRSTGMRFDFGYDIQRTGNEVTGQTFNQGYNQINLKLNQRGWNGRFGDMLISKAVITSSNDKRTEIEIATLPQGFFNFTLRRNKKGDYEFSGMGPRGNMNRSTLKANGNEFSSGSAFGSTLNLRRDPRKTTSFEGSFILNDRFGRMQNGFATLNVRGSLDPMIVAQDPVLYTLLYVLPFSR